MKGIILPKRILVVAALIGWSFDLFFYGKALGISLLLFVGLAVSALVYLGRSKAIRPKTVNLWLLLPLFLSAGMVALRANSFVIFLNVVACLFLLQFVVHFYTSGRMEQLGFFDFPVILTWVAAQSTVQAAPLVRDAIDFPEAGQRTRRNVKPLVRGLLLAAPILLVFTILFVSADAVFASYVGTVFSPRFFDLLFSTFWRGFLIVGVTWLAAGAISYSLLHQSVGKGSSAVQRLTDFARRGPSLGFTEAAVILSSVNALFLSFVVVQFSYLFGGERMVTIDGRGGTFTYADYTRRGFFELVTVAVLTLALVLFIHWLTTRSGRNQIRLFNALSTLMSAFVMVMLVSAFQRLLLYEEAYGYTWLRLWIHTFMIWLGFVFVWFVATLWRSPARSITKAERTGGIVEASVAELAEASVAELAEASVAELVEARAGIPQYFAFGIFLAGLGFLFTLNAINPDHLIARQNLARYAETGDLDLYYLARLSDDALPYLIPQIGTFPDEGLDVFCDDLRQRRYRLNAGDDSWVSFNYGRNRARQTLNNIDWEFFCPEPINRG